jgi:hypothetical protein
MLFHVGGPVAHSYSPSSASGCRSSLACAHPRADFAQTLKHFPADRPDLLQRLAAPSHVALQAAELCGASGRFPRLGAYFDRLYLLRKADSDSDAHGRRSQTFRRIRDLV